MKPNPCYRCGAFPRFYRNRSGDFLPYCPNEKQEDGFGYHGFGTTLGSKEYAVMLWNEINCKLEQKELAIIYMILPTNLGIFV